MIKFFSKLLGRKAPISPEAKVRAIMERFNYACFVGLPESPKNESEGLLVLLFMLGATDMLCQVNGLERQACLPLFESMLKNELGDYSDEEAHSVMDAVLQATADSESQGMMKEGAESLRTWLIGQDIAGPSRLAELLNSL
jgi:hypothetical protein